MQRLNHRYNKITFGLALKSTNKNRMTFYFWTVAPQTQEESQMWNIVLLTLEDRIVTLLTTIRLEIGTIRQEMAVDIISCVEGTDGLYPGDKKEASEHNESAYRIRSSERQSHVISAVGSLMIRYADSLCSEAS
ncbi:hypothetical protein DPX16_9628 [Anabarilius grahami]|uniref:Uncharacterized protein n=1 Tax=Anabarilius grahami TaxID=495550 RepID=A0A3N0Y3E2_ANAGA|nr:hypothetical protein DPX16_9628 [Anabarilius grahami]